MTRKRVNSGLDLLLTVSLTVLGFTSLSVPARAATPRPLVQKRALRVTSGSSAGVAFRKPNTFGNLIVAYVVWDGGGAVSLSDSAGNTYVSALGPTQPAGDSTSAQVFYAANIAGGANTVTATFASPVTARGALYIHEYRGIDRVAPLDTAVEASGSSASMDSGLLRATSIRRARSRWDT